MWLSSRYPGEGGWSSSQHPERGGGHPQNPAPSVRRGGGDTAPSTREPGTPPCQMKFHGSHFSGFQTDDGSQADARTFLTEVKRRRRPHFWDSVSLLAHIRSQTPAPRQGACDRGSWPVQWTAGPGRITTHAAAFATFLISQRVVRVAATLALGDMLLDRVLGPPAR